MFSKNAAIRAYCKKLPAKLRQGYGTGPYTPEQVETTIIALKLNRRFIDYAFYLFCGKSFVKSHYDKQTSETMNVLVQRTVAAGFIASCFANSGSQPDGDADLLGPHGPGDFHWSYL